MGAVVFIDTSAFVSVLTNGSDRERFIEAINAADRRMTSPVVRLETCIVLSRRLDFSPKTAEDQFDRFLEDAEIAEVEITSAIGVEAVACLTKFGKGRHSARLNFVDCLSYACAKAHGARLLFKGDDFSWTDIDAL